MVAVGDKIPAGTVAKATPEGPQPINLQEWAAGRKTVIFSVPGPFTPTCHEEHLPSFQTNLKALKDKGVAAVACIAVADAFIQRAWQKATGADDIEFFADGDAAYNKSLDLTVDTGSFGGVRSKRYAMLLDDGVIKYLGVDGGEFKESSADKVLANL